MDLQLHTRLGKLKAWLDWRTVARTRCSPSLGWKRRRELLAGKSSNLGDSVTAVSSRSRRMRARTHWVAWWRKRGGRAAYHPRARGAAKMAGGKLLSGDRKGRREGVGRFLQRRRRPRGSRGHLVWVVVRGDGTHVTRQRRVAESAGVDCSPGFEPNSQFKPSQIVLNLNQLIEGLPKLKKMENKIWLCTSWHGEQLCL
jgi:hypothetical protein